MASFRQSLAAIGLFSSIAFSSAGHAVSVLPQQSTTGEDGIFSLSGDLSLAVPTDGIFNYTDFFIDAGANLSIQSDNPVFLYANDFHVNGAIYATVPELYLIGSTFEFGIGSSLANPGGTLALYATGSVTLAGTIDAGNNGSLSVGSDVPGAPTNGSVILLSGSSSLIQPVIISGGSDLLVLTGGDLVLQDGGGLVVMPLPGAAILFISGLLGLFARRWL